MKVADKRKVIEVLLCGARMGCTSAVYHLGLPQRFVEAGVRARQAVWPREVYADCFMLCGVEAAYRLIESSPTLVREWFGAP